ncbi:enoyl-CoA hydratase/isomerase family protein [Pseudomaricurvus sp. HS19]|uniref:enoyl-CoA hydratase/isomerase family protein n=1 Tax=Pseudomaricurvus sp. HS19 TaxID=2692626 RepID=UPI00136CA4FF|nr:enoyl-CoA hydratase/isomerase family protein [Pseudomaricurvus sp. HS19]MYM63917.1 enoyl-CoA hydratase/isomerase family protein [Pseudomaricurvus sp. HS19]
MSSLPIYETLQLTRDGRVLTITMNRPDQLNAVNLKLHEELAEVFIAAAKDDESDVVVLTGAGRAFSAGGDLDHILSNANNPDLFDEEVRLAKRIVFSMLDLDKPLICRMNGHAVGLGATIALFCDVVFASEKARIGDPHVAVGLVAGDGGAIIWPQLVGLNRTKEFLLGGDLLTAQQAADIGLINHCVAPDELDGAVKAYCDKLLGNSRNAVRWTKVLLNQELKRVTHSLLDTGLAYEAVSMRQEDHRKAVQAMLEKAK